MPLAAIPAAVGASLIGAGGSVAAGLIGAHGATAAANAQTAAAQSAMGLAGQNLQSALGPQFAQMGALGSYYQPYQMAGQQGVNALAAGLAPGGTLSQPWSQTFQAPTAAEAAATPGYQFALQQGLNAIQSGAAARGSLLTGGTQKNLANYATGLASQTYQQTYNNALSQYQTNYGTWANNQQNLYNRLMGLTGTGLTGNQLLGQQQGDMLRNIAALYGNNTTAMSQLYGALGAAQASGAAGRANAYGGLAQSAAGGLSGAVMGGLWPQQQQAPQWSGIGGPGTALWSPQYMPTAPPTIDLSTSNLGLPSGILPGT